MLVAGCVVTPDSTLTVTNDSSYDLHELYLTFSGASSWGPNRLRGDVLLSGDQITLAGITCDTYDARLVDETGAECEADAISLCFDDAEWVLTNHTCDVFKRVSDQQSGSRTHVPRAAGAGDTREAK